MRASTSGSVSYPGSRDRIDRCPNARELPDLQRRNLPPAEPASIEELLAGGDCAAAEAALKEALLGDPTDPHLIELHRRCPDTVSGDKTKKTQIDARSPTEITSIHS